MNYDNTWQKKTALVRRKKREEEQKGLARKKSIFKNLIRTDAEIELDDLKWSLERKKMFYELAKVSIKNDNYYLAERAINMNKYWDFIDKLIPKEKKERLSPTGGIDGIMFIGVNPSAKSMLVNVWDDTFGQYFGKMLEEAGINKNKVWMTNIYKKQTEENRPLNNKEVAEAIVELDIEIKYVNPKVIVTLGKQPGQIIGENFSEYKQIHLPHPAYIMRKNSPELRSKYLLELTKLKTYE